uniref:Uncharacterized protein n=1 Tax=Arcella intermedia TaxID=1963864 RepID=A0A6B2LG83_9EUKA
MGPEHIAVRPGSAGAKFAFVESWKAIELANSIFGFDGWSSQIVDITPDFIEDLPSNKFRVGVTAVVKVSLKDGTFHEDVGYGICENKSKGTAIENAKKEAVSDARKRALRVFGNALGNCVYDKEHIKKIKSQIKGAATSTVSYDRLRAAHGSSAEADPGVEYAAPVEGNEGDNDILANVEGNAEFEHDDFDLDDISIPQPQPPQLPNPPAPAPNQRVWNK